jgi:hypothetical protein
LSINSRVYIDNDVAADPILRDVHEFIYQVYIAQIMAASRLAAFVSECTSSRHIMNAVTTENFSSDDLLMKLKGANGTLSENAITNAFTSEGRNIVTNEDLKNHAKIQDLAPKEAGTLAAGRVVSLGLDIKNKDGEDVKSTVDCWVKLSPYFISPHVAREYIHLNSNLEFRRRMRMYKAEEIEFWRDLIFCCDTIKRRRNALRNDRSGALRDMLDKQSEGFVRLVTKIIEHEKTNIANTILIYSKRNFEKACANSGLDFRDEMARERFFARTFSMMCVVVDPYTNTVDVWMNGSSDHGRYPYEFIKKSGNNQKFDIMELLKTFQSSPSGARF